MIVPGVRRLAGGLGLALLVAACGSSHHGGTAPSNTDFLVTHNAQYNGGRTIRWPSLPIPVSLGGIGRPDEVTAWTGATGGAVTFTFVGSPPPNSIAMRGRSGTDICGVTTVSYNDDGTISSADIELSTEIFRGPQCVRTVTHEMGHAIGFLDHTADGGLMDDDGGDGSFTSEVTQMIRDLYSLAPGTVVASQRTRATEQRIGSLRRVTITYYPVRR